MTTAVSDFSTQQAFVDQNGSAAKGDVAPTKPANPVNRNGAIEIKGQFEIYHTNPLPQFNTPSAKAYEAKEYGENGRACMALVCESSMPVRVGVVRAVSGLAIPAVSSVLEHDIVQWPITNDQRLVIITNKPKGDKFCQPGSKDFPKLSETEIIKWIATPALKLLREYEERNVTFRGFNVYNLYWEDSSKQKLLFGEVFTTPSAYQQPAVYETIENSICDPSARGEGKISDDLFSIGVLMLHLSMGTHPLQEVPEHEIVFKRMEESSFHFYTGQHPIPAVIFDAARGLMADDEDDRWNLDDFEAWVRGSRQTAKTIRPPRRASRPFSFGGTEYLQSASLTYALSRNWADAAEVIRNKTLDAWLRRSLGNEKLAEDIQGLINPGRLTTRNTQSDDYLIAKACIALDKNGPIRFRNFVGRIDGLGSALAMAGTDHEKTKIILQIISARLPQAWLMHNSKDSKNYHDLITKYDSLPNIIDSMQPGFGLERAIYELNPQMPCLSPILKNFYITSAIGLLRALEIIGARSDRPSLPIDRHIAAFLGARMPEIKDADLRPLGATGPNEGDKILAMLNILAKMQRIYRIRQMPAVMDWCTEIVKPILNKYHNVTRRKKLLEFVMASTATGDLQDLIRYVDDDQQKQYDEAGFKRAAMEHAVITLRIANLEEMKTKQAEIARVKGEEVSVLVALALMIFYMSMLAYMYLRDL